MNHFPDTMLFNYIGQSGMRFPPRVCGIVIGLLVLVGSQGTAFAGPDLRRTDAVIYDATPAGIAASLEIAHREHDVLLVEHTGRIGGMVTNGLSHTDFLTFEGITGTYRSFINRVENYYINKYGKDSPQVNASFRGAHAEPRVNRTMFRRMIYERDGITVIRNHRIHDVTLGPDHDSKRIESASFVGPHDDVLKVRAEFFVDASYEGDLMAKADVPYRLGRESQDKYNESLAPEEADNKVQGYNFRLIMTSRPDNRVEPEKPDGYDRDIYLDIIPLIKSEKLKFRCRRKGGIYKFQTPPLPNGKYDVNDVSKGEVRLSLPDVNNEWPDGSPETRKKIFRKHLLHNVGLIYFLQNDRAVPANFRKNAKKWGFPEDEFVENGHLPERLYVREGRRMIGSYVFTQNDTGYEGSGPRSVLQRRSIAIGDYILNSHGTGHEGPRFGGTHTGEFYKPVPPYQIPYGTILPKNRTNLLVPVAVSSSHVAYNCLRLEPVFAGMGQAAGVAAAESLQRNVPVQNVPVDRIQRQLHESGAATIYVSDVLPGDDGFAAVQWWGTRGGLHGIEERPDRLRGEHIHGQYFEAYPGHAVHPDKTLSDKTKTRWLQLAEKFDLKTDPLRKQNTRGGFIKKAYELYKQCTE